MKDKIHFPYYILMCMVIVCTFSACTSLRQNILFSTEQMANQGELDTLFNQIEQNYVIAPNEYIAISIFTNKGERLVDPNNEFQVGTEGGVFQAGVRGVQNNNQQNQNNTNSLLNLPINTNNSPPNTYLVDETGFANLPLLGQVELGGLKLSEAAEKLKKEYATYYKEPFVVMQYLNKRVILMGALGDMVIPLRNEGMTLIEVLSLAGNFQRTAKASNIRIIRGDLQNPSIQIVDLTTIEGVKNANLYLAPNDIIYVEPRRRFDREGINDITSIVSPLITVISSITSVIALIIATRQL